jgi:hypothetical protein
MYDCNKGRTPREGADDAEENKEEVKSERPCKKNKANEGRQESQMPLEESKAIAVDV